MARNRGVPFQGMPFGRRKVKLSMGSSISIQNVTMIYATGHTHRTHETQMNEALKSHYKFYQPQYGLNALSHRYLKGKKVSVSKFNY